MRDEKLHVVVARSTFPSQNVQKHTMFGPLLEVEMSKKCTPLWHEAHFEVKMYKTPGVQTTFGRSDVVSRGKRKGLCTLSKVSKTKIWGFCSIFNNNRHCTTRHCNTLHYNYNYTFTTFHCTTLHYTRLYLSTLNYTTLHSTTLHSITLPYITLHYTTFHYTPLHYTQLHYTALHYTTLHYIPLR